MSTDMSKKWTCPNKLLKGGKVLCASAKLNNLGEFLLNKVKIVKKQKTNDYALGCLI